MRDSATIAPVFLVGCPRSGTTLLQRMLDAHPFVAITPETHFVRRFWFGRYKYRPLTNDEPFERLVNDIIGMPEFADMQLDPEAFRADAGRVPRKVPALFDLLLRSFRDRRGARIVGEKTPNHLLYMPILQRFFPRARFVHIVRDPRAVVSSWKTVPWSTGTIAGDAGVWRRYMRTARMHPPSRGSLYVMHYENLTTAPDRELRGVCDFLGIPYVPAMLAFHERATDTLDLAREPWKKNAALPVQARSRDDWRQTLAAAEVAEIEGVCRGEMVRHGYQPENAADSPWRALARRAVDLVAGAR
jgi:hypothetical protein